MVAVFRLSKGILILVSLLHRVVAVDAAVLTRRHRVVAADAAVLTQSHHVVAVDAVELAHHHAMC
jgi:hypothetical protein